MSRKKVPKQFAENAKLVNPTVKPQAKGQNYFSIALNLGIVCLFKSSNIGDMVKNRKCQFFGFFAIFAILFSDLTIFLQKCKN